MNKEELTAEIRKAFANDTYPDDLHIVYDNSGTHSECEEVREAFKGKSWQSLDDNFLVDQRRSISCFSSEGLHCYLPAFLILAINKFDESDDLPFNLISKLTLPTEMDIAIMANAIKSTKLDEQMPNVNFEEILQNQLQYADQDVHNFIANFSLFTSDQGIAVKHYLDFMQREHSEELSHLKPTIAIERYWFQFDL